MTRSKDGNYEGDGHCKEEEVHPNLVHVDPLLEA